MLHNANAKCFQICNVEQEQIFSELLQKPKGVKDEILGSRINISNKKVDKRGRGEDPTKTHNRFISTTYMIIVWGLKGLRSANQSLWTFTVQLGGR